MRVCVYKMYIIHNFFQKFLSFCISLRNIANDILVMYILARFYSQKTKTVIDYSQVGTSSRVMASIESAKSSVSAFTLPISAASIASSAAVASN